MKRSFEITVKFFVEAETKEEANSYLFDHMHRSLTGGIAREWIETTSCQHDWREVPSGSPNELGLYEATEGRCTKCDALYEDGQ